MPDVWLIGLVVRGALLNTDVGFEVGAWLFGEVAALAVWILMFVR